ncbi:MAG: 16S rRNA (uracil1498-N3)-methyltransferase [Verrucomicrobiales bacterium]|jgi:16S rRNA (uracil1498-N3)-methyltransferase
MSLNRYYIPLESWNLQDLALTGEEAHHCREVMRHDVGDKLVVFNGCGTEAMATVRKSGKDRIELDSKGVTKSERFPISLTLVQAVIKGKTMELILQKATELGVSKVVPLLSERTVVKLDAKERAKKRAKWERILIEACKQSGQNWLPQIEEPQPVETFFKQVPSEELLLIASLHPGARPLPDIVQEATDIRSHRPTSALIMIGPEGDFTPAEMATAQRQGCLPWALGPIVLRSETAALYTLSVLGYELGKA